MACILNVPPKTKVRKKALAQIVPAVQLLEAGIISFSGNHSALTEAPLF